MPHSRLRLHLLVAVMLAPVIALISPVWAQTPRREGNESDFKDWQPTRGQVSAEERAAGIRLSPTQRNAEDQELQQLDRNLMRQERPASPVPPTAPK